MSGGVPAGELLPVEQCDREAAASLVLPNGRWPGFPSDFLSGRADYNELTQAFARHRLTATPTPPIEGRDADVERVIAEAIGKADAAFGYSFNLTRLVDGEATHTLTMPGFDPVDFEDRDEGYALISERRNALRAAAIRAALQALGERG